MKVRELLRVLRQNGCEAAAATLKHPEKAGLVIVAIHGSTDVPSGTLKAIMKQAGLEVKK